MRVQFGGEPTNFKRMPTVGAGAYEIRVRDKSGAFRAIYVAKVRPRCLRAARFPEKVATDRSMDIELAKVRYRMIGGKL